MAGEVVNTAVNVDATSVRAALLDLARAVNGVWFDIQRAEEMCNKYNEEVFKHAPPHVRRKVAIVLEVIKSLETVSYLAWKQIGDLRDEITDDFWER